MALPPTKKAAMAKAPRAFTASQDSPYAAPAIKWMKVSHDDKKHAIKSQTTAALLATQSSNNLKPSVFSPSRQSNTRIAAAAPQPSTPERTASSVVHQN
jgi:hypothetical protein